MFHTTDFDYVLVTVCLFLFGLKHSTIRMLWHSESENYYYFFFSSNWGVPICLSRDRETQFTGTLFLELCICQSYSLLKDCTLLINPLSQMLVGQYGSLFGLVSAKFIYKCRCSEKSWIYLQDIWFKNRTIPRKYKKWYIIFSKLSCDKWNIIWSMKH